MVPAVFCPRLFGVTGIQRLLLPETDGRNLVGRNPQADEVFLCALRASFTQRHVVLGGSPLVAVPLDPDPGAGMLFQVRRDFLESGLVAILDQGLVEIEMDVRKRSTFLADSFLLLLPWRLSAIWWLIVPPLSIMLVIPTIGTI